jgi:hypothetical protein
MFLPGGKAQIRLPKFSIPRTGKQVSARPGCPSCALTPTEGSGTSVETDFTPVPAIQWHNWAPLALSLRRAHDSRAVPLR